MSEHNLPRYSVVVLAQHAAMLRECLIDLRQHTPHVYEWIVVNDGSQPEIQEVAEALMQDSAVPLQMIDTPAKLGVAAGYNQGMSVAQGERVVLMRDHVRVHAQWLQGMARALDDHPQAAMVAPFTHGVSGRQNTQVPVEALLKLEAPERHRILSIYGADTNTTRLLSLMLLVDREAFETVGGFDEDYALESFEDDDLCYRMLQQDYELYIAHDSMVSYVPPPPLFADDPGWYARQIAHNQAVAKRKWGQDIYTLLQEWKRPITVSLCMIVKNEEATLERCLSSVAHLVDEINIVDTGSTDQTKEIAARYTNRIFDFEWVNDFSAARNYSFTTATQEFVLWLDADDRLLEEDQKLFQEQVAALPAYADAVSLPYHLGFDAHGNVTSSLRRNRLVRRSLNHRWIGKVHEYLDVQGHILPGEAAVTHDRVHEMSSRNLNIYRERKHAGDPFSPRDTYYFANELYDHGEWEEAASVYEQFLAIENTWVEDRIGASGRAGECYNHIGQKEQARYKVLQSFSYALPRAENCCRLGSFYLQDGSYAEAIWWYKLATDLELPQDHAALINHACWTWIPHLQLCVCYDRLGQYEQAYAANEVAASYIPDDPAVIRNRAYLSDKLSLKLVL